MCVGDEHLKLIFHSVIVSYPFSQSVLIPFTYSLVWLSRKITLMTTTKFANEIEIWRNPQQQQR